MSNDHDPSDASNVKYSSGAGCLTRLYWMFLGNGVLAISFALLIDRHPRFPSLLDLACLVSCAALIAVRYVDVRYMEGETGDGGARATMGDWKRYALLLALGSAAFWLIVRAASSLFGK